MFCNGIMSQILENPVFIRPRAYLLRVSPVAPPNHLCYTLLEIRRMHSYVPQSSLAQSSATYRDQDSGRVDVSEPASISSGIAARYATAIFELAVEGKKLKVLEGDVNALDTALTDSPDFGALINSPIYTRDQQGAAITAIATKMKLSPIVKNTLGLMASNRRLFVLPHLVVSLRKLIADEKGEVTAEVTSAKALTKAQSDKLAKTLKVSIGKDIVIKSSVDASLIGGLIVKVGSKMIDTSIKSQLGNLQNAMKEVG